MRIHELDAHLINKIAAGEVIERPASLIKELIENSLDAESTVIEIQMDGGGTQRIRVSDNGIGMSQDELLISIQRHTTSKIKSEKDLYDIQTLGFRGEALASIVEVSRTSIISRSRYLSEGTKIEIEAGKVLECQSSGRGQGTTIDVRDLFFNTPARKKFLKSERTEYTHILRTVKKLILAHPQVHFKLIHGTKVALESPNARDSREVVSHLYSNDLAKSLLEVNADGSEISVNGFIAPPDQSRPDRNEQHLFVNGRAIKDISLNFAISKAYEGFIGGGRFPITFLFVQINPEMIDVNVHPKKEEVRFSNLPLVQRELKRAVGDALLAHGVVPSIKSTSLTYGNASHGMSQNSSSPSPPIAQSSQQFDLKRELSSRAGTATPAAPQMQHGASTSGSAHESAGEALGHDRVIGQLHGTYIVIQTAEGIELIDQHVAHERILYEKYLAQLTSGSIHRQKLLIPMSLEFSPDQAENLEKHLQLLEERLGVGIERFGGGTFILRDWPESLARDLTQEQVTQTLQRILQQLEHDDDIDLNELASGMAADLACEAAVVKNTPLTREAMEGLIAQLRMSENPYRCPHGRPVIIAYSLIELEKAFGRR
jgi:DNA mismatch repair protein MutL